MLSQPPHQNYTSMLLRNTKCRTETFSESGSLAQNLPNNWPMWANPDYKEVKEKISIDHRWNLWVEQCKK